MGKKPKASAESKKLQAEQAELAKAQQQQIADQQTKLEEQERNASLEADRARNQRINGLKASRNRRRGRASLIKSGSELGTKGTLG